MCTFAPGAATWSSRIVKGALCLIATTLSLATGAGAADKFSVVHTFTGFDGGYPGSGLILGADGILYGTTERGGAFNVDCAFATCGIVFEMTPTSGGKWKESVTHRFHLGKDGVEPIASPVLDSHGNLYGTTYSGGPGNCSRGCGTVFELTRSSAGKWNEAVLYSFTGGKDGDGPVGGITLDAEGNLYGTTQSGGTFGNGVVFELSPTNNGQWQEKVLHEFTGGIDGANPSTGLVFDESGNIYGTAAYGGIETCQGGCGLIFKLALTSRGKWKETVLHHFTGSDGAFPFSTPIFARHGELLGSTSGGGPYNAGVVFRLAQDADGSWDETVLYAFTGGNDGNGPGQLTLGSHQSLFGTTYGGGVNNCYFGCGVAFKLTRMSDSAWEETVLHLFTGGDDGANPQSGLLLDAAGNLYGTTTSGGANSGGVVFELTP